MAKSRSEIQKAYRERQKAKGDAFLKKEKLRQRSLYTPAAEMTEKKRKERNLKNKLRNRLCRLRKRSDNEQTIENTSGYETGQTIDLSSTEDSDSGPSRLIVKLPIHARKGTGVKKLGARALSKSTRKAMKLQAENAILKRKLKIRSRKLSRLQSKLRKQPNQKLLTPSRKTDNDVAELNLTPVREARVRRKLLVGNAIIAEIKEARLSTSAKKRRNLYCAVSGRITKKYRCLNTIRKATGLSRKALKNAQDKNLADIISKERRECLSQRMQETVYDFLCRDDNSRCQPGKADAKKVGSSKSKVQTRVLTDYMKNLHDKFLMENPEVDLSLTTFQRLRPKHVLLTSFISRNTCQCVYHQNMALKVQAVRKAGVKIGQNPESLLSHIDDIDVLLSSLPEKVSYKVWKKVEIEPGKLKMKVIDQETDAESFKKDLKHHLEEFSAHVSRVREQYQQAKTLKENLPDDEIMLQMDFAENFSCRSLDEIQTAYWNQSMVTLHPVVAYYKDQNELKHQSFVVVSDEMSHSSSAVCAFLDQLMPSLKLLKPNLKVVHYWTDSPSSQYRNRFIFYTIANHQKIYGAKARWNYFEVGHGKGPCDGLGGTVKRMADDAIKQGNAMIQSPQEFFKWAEKSGMRNVKFIFVSKTETKAKQEVFNSLTIKPVKETLKMHAVAMADDNTTMVSRETSCYCQNCLSGVYCGDWKQNILTEGAKRKSSTAESPQGTVSHISGESDKVAQEEDKQAMQSQTESRKSTTVSASEGDFVASVYEGSWYIGQIVKKDVADGDYEVKFMTKSKDLYKWPQKEDKIWVEGDDILCVVTTMEPSGKSKRLFKMASAEKENIEHLFCEKKDI